MVELADENNSYANRFKVKIPDQDFNHRVKRIGELYGGIIESDARFLPDEYWYYTNTNKTTIEESILFELVE